MPTLDHYHQDLSTGANRAITSNFILKGNLSCDVKSHFRNIFSLSLLKTAIKDFNINEAMTRQIIFDKSEHLEPLTALYVKEKSLNKVTEFA